MKRQAARFRIYGLNAKGQAVCELNSSNGARIRWTVHLANKKSAWYQFQIPLDIPEAASAPLSLLRNAMVSDRKRLMITPHRRTICGENTRGGDDYEFNDGEFMGTRVYLGEIQTDHKGRLLVLGGRGKSASFNGSRAIDYGNNEGWHDDISDGPVTAKVCFKGQTLNVDPAWVVVAPPNYGPRQKSVRTMWDLIRDTLIQAGMVPNPKRPSFNRDIRPIFERLSNLQWMNAGLAAAFGWKGPFNFATPEWLSRLSTATLQDRELRRTIANQFRVYDRDSSAHQTWPWQYGDAVALPASSSPRENLSLSGTQLNMLQQWASGDFDEDYDPKDSVRHLRELAESDQPRDADPGGSRVLRGGCVSSRL